MTYDKWSGWDAPELDSQFEQSYGANKRMKKTRSDILKFLEKQSLTKEVIKIKKWMEKYFDFWK